MQMLFVFLVCLSASTIGGVCGVGGGVLIKPVLDAIGIMPVSTLSFLSGLTVLAMASMNLLKNRKSRELDVRRSVPLGLGAAAGGILGKYLFGLIRHSVGNEMLVGGIQAVVLGFLILGTLLFVINKARIQLRNVQSIVFAAGVGMILGICSSFLGIGGGPMNLAVLYYCFSMDTKKAALNSILIIWISQATSLLFSLVSATVSEFSWSILFFMVCGGSIGGLLSSRLHRKLSVSLTNQLFLGLLIIILFICIYNAIKLFNAV